jgi:hypothetical protein
MENTWGMRNENAAALDSESRIGCLDPESRISCRMPELVARIRFIWRPERRSPLWAVDLWNLMVRYRPRGGNPQAGSVIPHPLTAAHVVPSLKFPIASPQIPSQKLVALFLFCTDSWVCSASACCVDGEISCASVIQVFLYVIFCLQRSAGWGGVG